MSVMGSRKIKACYKEATEDEAWGRVAAICCISSRLPKLSLGWRGKINHDKDGVGEDKEEEWKEELKTQSSILLKQRSEGRGCQRTTSVGRRGQRVINVPFYEDWRKVSSLHQAVPGKHRPLFGNRQLRVGQLTHAFYHNLHCLQRLTGHPEFCISVRADSRTAERNSHKKRAVRQKRQNLDDDRTLTVFGESLAGWMHCWGADSLHQQLRVWGAGKNATQTNKSERCSNKSGEAPVVQLRGPSIG